MKLVYLACPYWHEDKAVREVRVEQVTRKTADLMMGGLNVFSPITHSAQVADHMPDEFRWNHPFWLSRDFQIITKCDELHVLKLPGWEKSHGVTQEITLATGLGMPIVYHEVG